VIRTVGLGERLRNVLQPVSDPIAVAFIFGSFARGEPHEASDVDVLIISRDNQLTFEHVTNLFSGEQDQIGREINPFLLTADEWRTKYNARNPFIRRVESGEKLFLIGDQDELGRLAKERVAQGAFANSTRGVRPARTGRSGSQKRKGKGARR
jgi:predicted nucleotidyltransferase